MSDPQMHINGLPFNETCSHVRSKLKEWATVIQEVKQHPIFADPKFANDKGEMIANLMLAYRHVEDATMRLGKAIQAFDGGKSVYDK